MSLSMPDPPAAPNDPLRPTLVVVLDEQIDPDRVPVLGRWLALRLRDDQVERVVCNAGAVARPDLTTVDVLCRFRLIARRFRRPLTVREASPDLLRLLTLAGLRDLIETAES
jgi:hypothetical protein